MQVDHAYSIGFKVMCIDTMITSCLINGTLTRSNKELLAHQQYYEYDCWILPLHLMLGKTGHWVLMVVDLKRQHLIYLDSLHHCPEPMLVKRILSLALIHAAKIPGKSTKYSDWKVYAPNDIPRQRGGYNCGIFVCVWIYMICQSLSMTFNQKDTDYGRAGITRLLASHETFTYSARQKVAREILHAELELGEDVENEAKNLEKQKITIIRTPPKSFKTADYCASINN